MIVDVAGVGIGLPIGNTPESLLDVRDSGMCFSRTSGTGSTSMIFTGEGAANNYPSSGRFTYAQMIVNSAWQGGEFAFWTKPWNSTTLTRALTIKDDQKVGIGTHQPSSLLHVNGSFAATSKAFDIPHEAKGGRWRLRHSAVESDDRGSTLYKRQIEAVQGNNFLELPEWFTWLCEDTMCFTSPVKHFGNSWAEVVGRTLQLTTTKAGKYNVLIFNTRKDHCAKECWLGVEYEQPETTE